MDTGNSLSGYGGSWKPTRLALNLFPKCFDSRCMPPLLGLSIFLGAHQSFVLILGDTSMTLLPVLNQFEHVLARQERFSAFWDVIMHQIHGRIHGFCFPHTDTISPSLVFSTFEFKFMP